MEHVYSIMSKGIWHKNQKEGTEDKWTGQDNAYKTLCRGEKVNT